MKAEDLKLIVKDKYGDIAMQSESGNQSSCCGSDCGCGDTSYTVIAGEYKNLEGYNPDADLKLGCGIPTDHASIHPGDSVLDLGSGAGNDCFVARALVGENGKVTGLDFTESMIEKAIKNLKKTGFTNIEFIYGDIENMPLPDGAFDVVISNCVLNLVPDKKKAFREIYRVLRPLGHFSISDVVLEGDLPKKLKEDAVMYAGCVSGAMQKDDYLEVIRQQGFSNIEIKTQKKIELPDDILMNYLDLEEIRNFRKGNTGIFSITVNANK